MIESSSYMQLRLHKDGEDYLELRVPTFWDEVEHQWIGMVKTPITKKIIISTGKNSFELQNSFNVELSKWFHHSQEMAGELISMFKTPKEWENEDKNNVDSS